MYCYKNNIFCYMFRSVRVVIRLVVCRYDFHSVDRSGPYDYINILLTVLKIHHSEALTIPKVVLFLLTVKVLYILKCR